MINNDKNVYRLLGGRDRRDAQDSGFSTQHVAKKLNIPHEVLLEVLQERKAARDEWQQKINKKYE